VPYATMISSWSGVARRKRVQGCRGVERKEKKVKLRHGIMP